MASIMVGAVPAIPLPLASYSHLASSQSKSLGISLSHSIPLPTLSTSSSSSASLPFVYCGRGDRKTERGKRFNHSFGNARPHGKKKGRGPPRIPVPPAPPKDDDEVGDVVKIEIDESLA